MEDDRFRPIVLGSPSQVSAVLIGSISASGSGLLTTRSEKFHWSWLCDERYNRRHGFQADHDEITS